MTINVSITKKEIIAIQVCLQYEDLISNVSPELFQEMYPKNKSLQPSWLREAVKRMVTEVSEAS